MEWKLKGGKGQEMASVEMEHICWAGSEGISLGSELQVCLSARSWIVKDSS